MLKSIFSPFEGRANLERRDDPGQPLAMEVECCLAQQAIESMASDHSLYPRTLLPRVIQGSYAYIKVRPPKHGWKWAKAKLA